MWGRKIEIESKGGRVNVIECLMFDKEGSVFYSGPPRFNGVIVEFKQKMGHIGQWSYTGNGFWKCDCYAANGHTVKYCSLSQGKLLFTFEKTDEGKKFKYCRVYERID